MHPVCAKTTNLNQRHPDEVCLWGSCQLPLAYRLGPFSGLSFPSEWWSGAICGDRELAVGLERAPY